MEEYIYIGKEVAFILYFHGSDLNRVGGGSPAVMGGTRVPLHVGQSPLVAAFSASCVAQSHVFVAVAHPSGSAADGRHSLIAAGEECRGVSCCAAPSLVSLLI